LSLEWGKIGKKVGEKIQVVFSSEKGEKVLIQKNFLF